MFSKPLRIFMFLTSAILVLAFTAGVTHAAGQFLAQNVLANTRQVATSAASSTVESSPTTVPSTTPTPNLTPDSTRQNPSKIEFSGVLTTIDQDWWTIGDYVVQVTAATEIEGQPAVGNTLWVEAFLQPDGSYIAHEISTHSSKMEDDDSHEGLTLTKTPEINDSSNDQDRHSGGQDMHDDDYKVSNHSRGSESGNVEDDHDHHDKGGSHEHSGDD